MTIAEIRQRGGNVRIDFTLHQESLNHSQDASGDLL